MVDYKRFAMVLGIMALLPLFFGLFFDAVLIEPKYEHYCNDSYYSKPIPAAKPGANCTYDYNKEYPLCGSKGGISRYKYDELGCQQYDWCDFCNKDYDTARQVYNRNLFLILAPLGLVVIILGLYIMIDYLGAGLMFGGLITLFYATIRYFFDMSKLLRALVILIELLIIIWIGYKKIDKGEVHKATKTSRKSNR